MKNQEIKLTKSDKSLITYLGLGLKSTLMTPRLVKSSIQSSKMITHLIKPSPNQVLKKNTKKLYGNYKKIL